MLNTKQISVIYFLIYDWEINKYNNYWHQHVKFNKQQINKHTTKPSTFQLIKNVSNDKAFHSNRRYICCKAFFNENECLHHCNARVHTTILPHFSACNLRQGFSIKLKKSNRMVKCLNFNIALTSPLSFFKGNYLFLVAFWRLTVLYFSNSTRFSFFALPFQLSEFYWLPIFSLLQVL